MLSSVNNGIEIATMVIAGVPLACHKHNVLNMKFFLKVVLFIFQHCFYSLFPVGFVLAGFGRIAKTVASNAAAKPTIALEDQ